MSQAARVNNRERALFPSQNAQMASNHIVSAL